MPRRPRSPASPRAGAPAHEALDWLRLARIQGYGHLGITQKERELGQRIEADVELAYAPTTKRRPDVIDVRSQIEMSRCRLLETLAEELALALIQEFDSPRVRVHVRKLHVPVEDFTTTPEVILERVKS